MTILVTEVYDAFKEANVSDPTARKAAEAMAGYDNRLAAMDTRLAVLTWMTGANAAMTLAVLLKLFIH
jgi:hypothetical protein